MVLALRIDVPDGFYQVPTRGPERGLADGDAGRTTDVPEVRAKYGLPE